MWWISSILVPTGRTKTSKCWEVGLGFKFKFEFEIRIQKKIKATLIQEYHGGSAGRGDLGKDILLGRRLPVQPKGPACVCIWLFPAVQTDVDTY